MDILHAEAFLDQYGAGNTRLADLYDDDEMLRSVVNTLFPGFEYPDYSYLTMNQLRQRYKANPLPLPR